MQQVANLCPYVQRTGQCYIKSSCAQCSSSSLLAKMLAAPVFKPGESSKPKPPPRKAELAEVDLDSFAPKQSTYKKFVIPGGVSATMTAADTTAAFKESEKFPKLPEGMEFRGDTLDKSNLTVIGDDGKRYSVAALMSTSTTTSTAAQEYDSASKIGGGGGAGAGAGAADYSAYEEGDFNEYFYEPCKDCDCCKGFVYNCSGMKKGDISCIDQCYCLTEMMHHYEMLNA